MIGIKPPKDKKATPLQLIEITIINTGTDPTRMRRLPKVVQAVKYFTNLAKVAGYSDKETAKNLGRERTTILHHRKKYAEYNEVINS